MQRAFIRLTAAAAAVWIACQPVSAAAQTRADNKARCAQFNDSADLAIGACTAFIQSGEASTAELVQAFVNRGNAYDNRGDADKALKDYGTALGMDPRSFDVFLNRGIAYVGVKDFDHALADENEAVAINAASASARMWRALVQNAFGRYADALTDITEAERLGITGHTPPIEDRARHVRVTAENGTRCAAASADRDLRIGSCTAVIGEPGTPRAIALAYNNRGIVRSGTRDYQGAFEDYTRAQSLSTDAVFASNRGVMAVWLDQADIAAASFEQSLRLAPDNLSALNGQGLLARQGGDFSTALARFSRVIAGAPTNAGYLNNRGLTYLLMGDLDRALADINAALAVNPKEAYALYARGIIKKRRGDLAGSAADVAAAIAAQPAIVVEMKRRHLELPG